jgi:hypothetical protein
MARLITVSWEPQAKVMSQRGGDEHVLRRIVPVERALRDICLRRNAIDTNTMYALMIKEFCGNCGDPKCDSLSAISAHPLEKFRTSISARNF